MASTELTEAAPARARSLDRPAAAFLATYAALWASTLAAAAATTIAGASARHAVRRLLGLTLTPDAAPSVGRILAIAAHNLPIAAWPLLLGIAGTATGQRTRTIADSVLVGCTVANTLPVGAAIGAYGTPLLRYIPQLPLEWAGLAVGYSSWLAQRRQPLNAQTRLAWLAAVAVIIVIAAATETIAVPERASAVQLVEPLDQPRVHRTRLIDGKDRAAAAQVSGEHPRRQQQHASLAGGSAIQIGAAEHQQRLRPHAGERFDALGPGVGLAQPEALDARHPHRAAMALRLDREDAARADHDVVDVAGSGVDVLQRKPTVAGHALEDLADAQLAVVAANTALQHTLHATAGDQHRCDQRQSESVEERRMADRRHGARAKQHQQRQRQHARHEQYRREHQDDTPHDAAAIVRRSAIRDAATPSCHGTPIGGADRPLEMGPRRSVEEPTASHI